MEKNIMLIGFGPHAKRIYFPLVEKFQEEKNFQLVLAIDIEKKREDIRQYLKDRNASTNCYLIPEEHMSYDKLHPEVERHLDKAVERYGVEGVIIASEPLTHVMYAKWALKRGLSILMDKPVSTYENISTESGRAEELINDFIELEILYREARKKNSSLSFSLMAQRRFHPAFKKVREIIRECFEKTGCPVTSIQTFHCDGQWRMPSEIVDQLYHPYMQGYGKCSHSGYHFFDIVPFMLEGGLGDDKYYDNIEVFSQFVRPLDFMQQITLEDYENLFGKQEFWETNKYTQRELNEKMKGFGEIDAFSNICFKKGDKTMTVASLNLAHNGFARRDWVTAKGRDLYKGNGRVRHEQYVIEQGPFQAIHYQSYQSKEVDPKKKQGLYEVGSEYHLDIYVYKNTKMIGGKSVEKFTIKDLNINIMEGKSRGHQEDARAKGFTEFIEAMHGTRKREAMTSDFSTHGAAVLITSAIYQSACAQLKKMNPLIRLPFHLGKGLQGLMPESLIQK
ncbi:MAG: Gfo/Idh/MocA family oxidoreductase [Candidatus Woesearchaeota archaeon]